MVDGGFFPFPPPVDAVVVDSQLSCKTMTIKVNDDLKRCVFVLVKVNALALFAWTNIDILKEIQLQPPA